MQLNLRVLYALEALREFARADLLTIDDIAQRLDISVFTAMTVNRALMKGGFIKSQRGAEGGYRLAKPLDKIMMDSLIGAVDSGFFDDDPDDSPARAAIRKKLRQRAGWHYSVSEVL